MEGGAQEYTEASNGDQQYAEDQTTYEQQGYEQQQESTDTGETVNPGDRINASKNDDDEKKIFVGGLSWETTTKDLRDYFTQFGQVADCTIKQDPETGRSRGFGFVLFTSSEALQKVLSHQLPHTLHGKTIDPKKAKARGGREPVKKVFVGGLDPETPEDEIRDHFSKFGKIEEIDLPFDKMKGQRRAFCFITFESEAVVDSVVSEPKQLVASKEVDVKKATPKNDRGFDGGFGGGFGGRGGRGRGGWGGDQRGGRGGRGGGRGGYNQGGWGNQGYGGYGGGGGNDYYNQGYGGYDYYNQGYGGYGDYSQYYNQNWGNYNQGGYGNQQGGYGQGGYDQGYGGGYDYSWYGNGNQGGQQQGGTSSGNYKAKAVRGGAGAGAGGAGAGYHPYTR